MIVKTMSLSARRELLTCVRQKYQAADWADKGRVLDGFVAAAGYERKYAIQLLNGDEPAAISTTRLTCQKYDDQVRQALIRIWHAANQICSKRLVPFLPQFIEAMERHGHLRLPSDVRAKLLTISAATVDRLLSPSRESGRRSVSTTRRGSLLKNKIQIRTFADWDDVTPGFFEADLVAHCGGNTNGAFLNTLVLVDISTGWLECMPLLRKSAKDVIDGLRVADLLLPFPLQGLDTDCGSEFINYELLDYCEENHITFTRARTHRKNDQAHVEEKNGSVVRRLVGYDRFEGTQAWTALAQLYRVLRAYVNFYQPSLKLMEKERLGANVSKKYDSAKTPYQRILLSEQVSSEKKLALTKEYKTLNPVRLMEQLRTLQDELWRYYWCKNGHLDSPLVVTEKDIKADNSDRLESESPVNRYYKSSDKVDLRRMPRTWRTRKDPFEEVWDEIRLRLEIMPESTATEIMVWLMEKYPTQFSKGQTRTLQRKVASWRKSQESQEEKLRAIMLSGKQYPSGNHIYNPASTAAK
jgi:hypothetical protein